MDHLLGGDYPVNASELSILKIILEWLEAAQGTSGKRAVATLLSRIDFGQINREDLKGILTIDLLGFSIIASIYNMFLRWKFH